MIDISREKPIPVRDAAELFGVTPHTVYAWIRCGLETFTIRRRIYTSVEALQRFAASGGRRKDMTPEKALQTIEHYAGV